MKPPLDRSGELTAFALSVAGGGFSAAARRLAVTPSAVAKQVTRLEDRLGVKLIHRSTRRLTLTTEGSLFYERAQGILAQIEQAESEVTSAALAPRGQLRLHSGTAIGLHHLASLLPEFSRRYPDVFLEIKVDDRPIDRAQVDLEEGADIVLRTGTVEQLVTNPNLVTRRVCDLERKICASPAYLDRHGTPTKPNDLAQHECLRLLDYPDLAKWPFRDASGLRYVQVGGKHCANNAETLLLMALSGLGIVRLVDPMVSQYIVSGQLVPLLRDFHQAEPVPLQIVMPRDKHRLPRVRVMVDYLIEKLSTAPWREPQLATLRDEAKLKTNAPRRRSTPK